MNQGAVKSTLSDIRNRFDFDIVALTDLNSGRRSAYMVRWKYNIGSTNDRWGKIATPNGKGVPGVVMKTGKSLIVENIDDTDIRQNLFRYPILRMENLQSFIALPLWNDAEGVIGVVLLGNRRIRRFPKEEYESIKRHIEATLRQQILKELMVNE